MGRSWRFADGTTIGSSDLRGWLLEEYNLAALDRNWRGLYPGVEPSMPSAVGGWRYPSAEAADLCLVRLLDVLAALPFPLVLWRGVGVSGQRPVRLDRPGKHWSLDRGVAETFARHGGRPPVLLRARVEDPADVDWRDTVLRAIQFADPCDYPAAEYDMGREAEVVLRRFANIEIVSRG